MPAVGCADPGAILRDRVVVEQGGAARSICVDADTGILQRSGALATRRDGAPPDFEMARMPTPALPATTLSRRSTWLPLPTLEAAVHHEPHDIVFQVNPVENHGSAGGADRLTRRPPVPALLPLL